MTLNDQIAREVIRDRTVHRGVYRQPGYPRTARALRSLAARIDRRA